MKLYEVAFKNILYNMFLYLAMKLKETIFAPET